MVTYIFRIKKSKKQHKNGLTIQRCTHSNNNKTIKRLPKSNNNRTTIRICNRVGTTSPNNNIPTRNKKYS